MGAADEVKGLIQLAGGIIMGGLALYKLTNVEDTYDVDEPRSYPSDKRAVTKPQAGSTPSQRSEKKRLTSKNQSSISWRSTQEVSTQESPVLGNWQSEAELLEPIEFEKETKESSSSSVQSTAASSAASASDSFESDEDDNTPSWMSKKDPQVGITTETVPHGAFSKHTAVEGVMQSGNEAVSHLAHSLSDTVFVYPLISAEDTQSSFFGQPCVDLSKEKGMAQRSAFGHGVDVKVMETRAGAGSAVLGSLLGGSKTTVLTNSETLKYMLPSMFEIAENRLPTVFHVAACKIDPISLEITTDFADVMRVRETGFAMLAAGGSQEVFDMGVVSHVAAQELDTPMLHFFDAVRGVDELSRLQSASMDLVAEAIVNATQGKSGAVNTFGLEAAASKDRPYLATAIQAVMKKMTPLLASGKEYKVMEYTGPEKPEAVVVAMGATAVTVAQAVEASGNRNVGVINVRLLRPWSSWHFLNVLPKSVEKICVLDQSGSLNPLFLDVAAALHSDTARSLYTAPLLVGGRVNVGGLGFDVSMALAVISNILAERPQSNFNVTEENHAVAENTHKNTDLCEIVVLGDTPHVSEATAALATELGSAAGLHVQQMATQDPYAFLYRSDLRIAANNSELPVGHAIKAADVVVADEGNLETAVATVRRGGSIVLAGKVSSLGHEYKASVVNKNVNLYSLNDMVLDCEKKVQWLEIVAALALGGKEAYSGFFPHVRNAFRISGHQELSDHAEHITNHLTKHGHAFFQPPFHELLEDASDSLSVGSMSQANSQRSRIPKFSARFAVRGSTEEKSATEEKAEVVPQHELAWSLMFKETFQTHTALRPAHHDVHFATVTKLERLTPADYSRNIFHMEFDISKTPLKYQIGDALGVFGHNDEEEVDKFIAEYGVDPNTFVRLPQRGALSKSVHTAKEYISARNLLVQHLDLFGRPSKKFYTALAQYATSRYEYLRLMHIGTDDTESFKLGIHETQNFADILLQYKTARPSIEELAVMIPEIKARHYSISSSMKVCPRSVHLLVVAVDWETPLGRRRSGQCTRYLKNLKVGEIVSVDIQQSVLRLPPNPTQPIVMAGLGTGMAPFRAFLQERLWQREAGIKVGPCVLYFGARHKAQEWLYGEELEKYERMGLVKLGLAWSRDQKHKVYIQHKIKEDSKLLKEFLGDKKGYFYLCGPTWPVPDVRDAIASGLTPEKVGPDGEVDVEAVQELKDEGRYILEVY